MAAMVSRGCSRAVGQHRVRLGLISDIVMDLDTADTLCFQLGRVRKTMTWRHFILALGLHTEQEMAEAGFGAY
ncbi:hypothetical protein Tco_0614028 [Tanacetum coccineum]